MGIGAAVLAFLGKFAPLRWFLETLLNSFGKALNEHLEELGDDATNVALGRAVSEKERLEARAELKEQEDAVEDAVRALPDDGLDRELRRWGRPDPASGR